MGIIPPPLWQKAHGPKLPMAYPPRHFNSLVALVLALSPFLPRRVVDGSLLRLSLAPLSTILHNVCLRRTTLGAFIIISNSARVFYNVIDLCKINIAPSIPEIP